MANRNIQTVQSQDGKVKRLNGAPEFEKFQNSFLDMETVDRLVAQDCLLNAHVKDSDFDEN
jgi:hypothetical protein